MEVDNRKILVAIIVTTLLLFPTAALTSGALRITLSLLFVLFFPGYTLLSALFPKQGNLGGVARIALSFGQSLALTIITGAILNYTPWGISLYPILISITFLILAAAVVAWYRQRALPPGERLSFTISITPSRWAKMAGLDRALSISLVVAILVALGSLGYVLATPKQEREFTEFYILGAGGKAENYPKQVMLENSVEVIIGVVNHADTATSYLVDIRIGGTKNKEVRTQALANGEKWEEMVSFVPQISGEEQKVEFWLYKDDEAKPYFKDPLHLYISVTEPSSSP